MSLSPTIAFPDEVYVRRLLSDFGTPINAAILQKDLFTGNGSTTIFNLSQTPDPTFPVFLYQNTGTDPSGPWVLQTSGYTQVVGIITFSTPPAAGTTWKACYTVQF